MGVREGGKRPRKKGEEGNENHKRISAWGGCTTQQSGKK